MGNGFEALKPMAAELKAKARERQEQKDQEEKVQARVARDTLDFLHTMKKTGVKVAGNVKVPKAFTQDNAEPEINFAAAMKMAGVEPLGAPKRVQHKKVVKPEPRQTIADNAAVLEESLSDDFDSIEFLESDDGKSFRRPGVGPDVPRDLRRGRWVVVGQLDLHGMFVEEARIAVVDFLKKAQMQERLCLRIIHGKGNGSPDRQSILREVVRRWLKQRDEVIAFCEARENDGGAGATIVRLKPLVRNRPEQRPVETTVAKSEID